MVVVEGGNVIHHVKRKGVLSRGNVWIQFYHVVQVLGVSLRYFAACQPVIRGGGAENAGVENAGVKNAGAYRRGGKCSSGKCRSDKVWKAIRKNTLKHQTKYGCRGFLA